MKNIYYIIWVDSILRIKKYHPNEQNWKFKVFFLNTWTASLNFWLVAIWMKFFHIFTLPIIEVNIFGGELLDNLVAYIIEFVAPFGILNYFLIFYNKRYIRLIDKYKTTEHKYAFIYSFTVLIFSVLTAYLYYFSRNR